MIIQVAQQVTHTNLDTGFTLTEVDHYVIHEGPGVLLRRTSLSMVRRRSRLDA